MQRSPLVVVAVVSVLVVLFALVTAWLVRRDAHPATATAPAPAPKAAEKEAAEKEAAGKQAEEKPAPAKKPKKPKAEKQPKADKLPKASEVAPEAATEDGAEASLILNLKTFTEF